MLFLGEQKTIEQLVEVVNELNREAKHYEDIATEKREQAERINELIRINVAISDNQDTLLWCEQKAVGMDILKQAPLDISGE
jgi:hypothetical protein